MLVAPGISKQLDVLKHTYHGLPDLLTQAGTPVPHTAAQAGGAEACGCLMRRCRP